MLLSAVVAACLSNSQTIAADLVWNTATGTWSTSESVASPWTGGAVFADGDNVTFGTVSGQTAATVTLGTEGGDVTPGSMLFNADSTTYIVKGSATDGISGGSINGSGGITKSGTSQVTFHMLEGLNFTGNVNIEKGVFLWGGNNAGSNARTVSLGQGQIIVHNGATFRTHFNAAKSNSAVVITNQVVLKDGAIFGVVDGGYTLQGGLVIEGAAKWEGSSSGYSGIDLRITGEVQGGPNAVWTIDGNREGSASRANNIYLDRAEGNSYSGTIIVNGGSGTASAHTNIVLGSEKAAQFATFSLQGNAADKGFAKILIASSLTAATIGGVDSNSFSTIEYAGTGATLTINTAGNHTYNGLISAATLSLQKSGSGTQAFNEEVAVRAITVTEGTLMFGGAVAARAVDGFNVQGGTLGFNYGATNILLDSPLSGAGTVVQYGTGSIQSTLENANFTGTFAVYGGGTLTAGTSSSFGTGTIVLDNGTLNAQGNDIAANININTGTLQNASNIGTASVSINQNRMANISLGGLNAGRLTSVNMTLVDDPGDVSAVVTDMTGHANLTGTTTGLGISSSMVADNNTSAGNAAMQFTGDSSLTLGNLNVVLTNAAATKLLDAAGTRPQYIHIANATTTINGVVNFMSPYHALSWLYDLDSGTSNGWIKLNLADNGSLRLIVKSDQNFTVNSYNDFAYDKFVGVTNNGTMTLTLGTAPSATDGLVIKDLEGSNSNAVINAWGSTTDSRIILRDDGTHTESLYQGSLVGQSKIVKDGSNAFVLTINGTVEGSQLDVQNGGLVLNGTVKIAGSTTVNSGATLSLNGQSASTSGLLQLDGTLNLGSNTHYTAGSLAGAGTAALNNSTLTLQNAPALDAKITGTGTLDVQNGNMTFAANGALGDSIILNLGQAASFDVTGANDARNIIGGLTGTGTLNLDGGTLQIKNQGGTFSGALNATGSPSTINYAGGNTQVFNGAGNALVNMIQSGAGTTQLTNSGAMSYRDVSATAGTLQIGNDLNSTSLTIGPGATFVSKVKANGASSLVTTGDLTMGAGGKAVLDLDATTVAAGTPLIKATGTITEPAGGAPFTITVQGTGNVFDWTAQNIVVNVLETPHALNPGLYDATVSKYFDVLAYTVDGYDFSTGIKINLRNTGENTMLRYANSSNTAAAANSIWNSRYQAQKGGTLNSIFSAIINEMLADQVDTNGIAASLASFSGSSVTSILGSTRDGVNQQVMSIRNRVAQMGLQPGNTYNDLPYVNSWIQGNGGWNRLDQDGDQAGYDLDTWGGTVGCDVNITQSLTAGAAFTANHSKIKTKSYDYATGDNNGYYVNLFARLEVKKWTHMLILTGGWNDINLDRTIYIKGLDPIQSNGDTNGKTFGAFYEGTYDFKLNRENTTVLQPLVNASIYRTSIDSYTESGAGDASMNVDSMDATHGRIGLGARIMSVVGSNLFGREAIGEFRVQAVQDYGDKTNKATLVPIGAPGSGMTVHGAKAGRTGVQIGAGLAVPVSNQGTIFVDVDTDFRTRATNVTGNLGYRYNF